MTQTATGLFDTYEAAARAVAELERIGIPHGDISIVANNSEDTWASKYGPTADQTSSGTATGTGAGAAIGGGVGLLAGLGLLAIPGLGPVVAAGWLAATLTGAAAGAVAGGLVGALTSAGVSEEHAHVYAEGVRRGGSLVTARVPDSQLPAATAILQKSNAVDPAVRRVAYVNSGWKGFDPQAPSYTREQVEKERTLY